VPLRSLGFDQCTMASYSPTTQSPQSHSHSPLQPFVAEIPLHHGSPHPPVQQPSTRIFIQLKDNQSRQPLPMCISDKWREQTHARRFDWPKGQENIGPLAITECIQLISDVECQTCSQVLSYTMFGRTARANMSRLGFSKMLGPVACSHTMRFLLDLHRHFRRLKSCQATLTPPRLQVRTSVSARLPGL